MENVNLGSMSSPLTARELKDREKHLKEVGAKHQLLREAITKKSGIDPETKIDWDGVSVKTLRDNAEAELLEANAPSTNGQLFRYGIQKFMFDAYKEVPTIYEDLVRIVPSKNRQEWYAPLYGAEIPADVGVGEKFGDSRIKGLDTVVINKKVGRLLSIEREMFDDDQTGQVMDRASRLGQRMKYKEEKDVITAIEGATYSTTIGNRPSGYTTTPTQALVEAGDIALFDMKDPLGNNMLVVPSLVLCGSSNKFNFAKLLNSSLQPSVPLSSAGATGYTMAVNPLQGLYGLKVSRFMAIATNWLMLEAKTSVVFQDRDALEIVQENPLSGDSFSQDIYKWRIRRRYQVKVIESRYIYAGSL